MSILEKTTLKEFLITLPNDERLLFRQYTEYLPPATSIALTFMTAGANLIPQGHYRLAEKSLLKGAEIASNPEDKARLHLNLAQLYFDLFELTTTTSYRKFCYAHCQKCIELGYFSEYISEKFNLASHMPIQ